MLTVCLACSALCLAAACSRRSTARRSARTGQQLLQRPEAARGRCAAADFPYYMRQRQRVPAATFFFSCPSGKVFCSSEWNC